MEKGDNVKAIFNRFANATKTIQEVLKNEGKDFMHNDHLGFVLTCPSNLGTGLRAGAMVKLPLLSARKDFKTICGKLGLQARGCGGVDSASVGGTWDISNADRLGMPQSIFSQSDTLPEHEYPHVCRLSSMTNFLEANVEVRRESVTANVSPQHITNPHIFTTIFSSRHHVPPTIPPKTR